MKGAGPRTQSFVFGLAGFAALLLVWQVVGQYQLMGPSWPALSDVLRKLGDPNSFGLFQRAASATLASAAEGYALGATAGISLAMLARVVPLLGPGTSNLAALANSIPMIALGPIFLILMSRSTVPAAVASIHVLFICYVALNSGFKTATRKPPRSSHLCSAHRVSSGCCGWKSRRLCRHWQTGSAWPFP
jgi:ABC-type nitrate/sulfonate/bicarbonate transport system permease component